MWKKAKRFLAVLVALTLVLSVVDKDQLFVSASATSDVQPDAGGETDADADNAETDTDTGNVETGAAVEEQAEETDVMEEESSAGGEVQEVPGPAEETDAGTPEGGSTADEAGQESGTEAEESEKVQNPADESENPADESEDSAEETDKAPAETDGEAADSENAEEATEPEAGKEQTGEGSVTEPDTEDGTVESTVPETEEGQTTADEADAVEESEEEEAFMADANIYEASVQDISVNVWVPDGAVPEGSVLVAEAAKTKDVESTMEQEEIDYEGYVALDVHFEYDGEEIEPLLPVTVAFIMKEDVIPAEAETTVHHLVEDEQGSVADVETLKQVTPVFETDLTEVPEAEKSTGASQVVAVEAPSFSTFVITWTITSPDNVVMELPVTLLPVDEEGASIGDGIGTDISVEAGAQEVVLLDQVAQQDIEEIRANGHTYQYDFSATGGFTTGSEITKLKAGLIRYTTDVERGDGYWEGTSRKREVTTTTTYYYGVWAGDNAPAYENDFSVVMYRTCTKAVSKTQTYWVRYGWVDDIGSETEPVIGGPNEPVNVKNVYLVYERQPDNIMEHTDEVHLDKYVEANLDGTYTLTLTSYVTGTAGEKITDTDFVLVLDCSGSMGRGFGETISHDKLDKGKAEMYGNGNSATSYYTTASPNGSSNGSAVYYQNGRWYAGRSPLTERQSVYVRRIGALKEAACSFVDELYQQDRQGHYQVGIVTFADNASISQNLTALDSQNDVNTLKTKICSLSPDGSTYSDKGMEKANEELRSSRARSDAQKVAILFTDGGPGYSGWGSGDATSTANGAIGNAYKIKASTVTNVGGWNNPVYGLGGKVYSISIVNGSNPNSVTSDMDKYMNYVSSNYPTARNMNDGGTGGQPGTAYYKVANDVKELVDAFKEAAGGAGISLDAETEVRDYLAANFELATGNATSDIEVFTQNAAGYSNGTYTFDGNNIPYMADVSVDDGMVTVKGFNYSDAENYVTGAENGPFSGKMLVVEIDIKYTDSGCFGGNNIPTNTSDTAIYADADGDDEKDKVKAYPQPLVNIPVDYQATSKDQTIYVTNAASVSDMLEYITTASKDYTPNGTNNRYVDIVYSFSHGADTYYYKISAMTQANSGSWYSDAACTVPMNSTQIAGLTDCTEYAVTCTVKPVEAPHKDDANRDPAGTAAVDTSVVPVHGTAHVHVFYPEVSCEDQWIDIGGTIDVSEIGEETGWHDLADNHECPPVSGDKPVVTIEAYDYITGALTEETAPEKDTDYTLKVKVGSMDVTNKTSINKDQQTQSTNGDTHESDCYDHETADTHDSGQYDFRVHVIGYKVTVIKNVVGNMGNTDSSAKFPFRYTISGGRSGNFSISDKGRYVIDKVKKGAVVSIIESGTYDANGYNTDGYKTTIGVDGNINVSQEAGTYTTGADGITENTTVTFTNERNVNPPTGFEDNNAIYLIMMMSASGVAVWFVAMYLIRRSIRYRRRE